MAPIPIEMLTLGGFALIVGASLFLLVVQRPTVTRPLVFSVLPWLATATVLGWLRPALDYPPGVETVLRFPWVYLLLACLCVLAWTMFMQLRTTERARAVVPTYLALMGVGVLLGPVGVLVLVGGASMSVAQLLSWLVAPVVALVVTYVALISLGLWLPRTAAFVGTAGGVVLFGAALDAVVTGLAISLGAPSVVLTAAIAPSLAAMGDVSPTAVTVWADVWIRLLVAVGVLGGLALMSRSRRSLAEYGLHVGVVLSVIAGTNALVAALSGGVLA